MSNRGNGNKTRDLDVDYSQAGGLVAMNNLATMLGSAMQQQNGTGVVNTTAQTVSQPTPIIYPSPQQAPSVRMQDRLSRRRVPEIEIDYVETYKAHRFHPHNPWRYFWHPATWCGNILGSPVGVCCTAAFLVLSAIGFVLNSQITGPGYAAGKEIKVIPDNLPSLAVPVVRRLN
ncbi:hypothetical protein DSM106972_048860 [Dulcicalothrix desertica PCC 7102]|uniref:Uncharacterized protein n=1 Tax=Dulcicalothrix desertica PCC 7102 TaxID=232991 RepID=A0A433VCX5_9CYAN|nr:hypothetical protein [Dulcicalothrix desertica]RUT03972.1 hypothetical protein DSM106972_048860 [Dulcicalothrix desertica PCC 7102]TWH43621.1 hypothetical protein CAL7102_07358 [Dulcicalothrix desertica PCC 7102]